jgi:hypothetical protein
MLKTREKTLGAAASKSGMDEKTARKYLRSGKLPSQSKIPHTWKTRKDPFADVWEAGDRICGKRLKAVLTNLVDAMERHGHLQLDPEVRRCLLLV